MPRATLFGYAAFVAALAAVWGIEIWAVPWVDMYLTSVVVRMGINMLAAVGLSLVLGITGQFSLGHAGFMAIGAYVAGYLSLHAGLPPMAATLVGGVVAALGGLAVGLPSLRLSGDYLAVVTLGFNGIIIVVIQNTKALGAALGLTGLPQATNFGWTYTWLLLGTVFLRNLVRSAHGRTLMAVRDNEIAVRSLGIDTTRAKVTAFVIGAFWAGISGGLIAFLNASISPGQFDYNRSIELVAMVVLGGTASLSGALLAAGILTVLPELLRVLPELMASLPLPASLLAALAEWLPLVAQNRMVLYSFVLIVMMLMRPQGLMGSRELIDLFWRPKKVAEV
ncbi:MAG TPA: branched-chain amino acid ABC transporter permease [Myxococcota bacterium]|nr:branched-chain amino acid ABC transporter permease [Myxococcota bacterium]HND32384.1 branched-chain amino acid ABC transporter permease [Myxococcota bacterium]